MIPFMEKASYDWSEDSVRIINTPSNGAKMTFFYVQEMGYFKTLPPYFTERAGLASYLILYTLNGKGTLEYEGESYTLKKDDCFFIDCMKPHKYYTPDKDGWKFLWLHFYGSSSAGYYDEFVRNGFKIINIEKSGNFEKFFRELLNINIDRIMFNEAKSSALIVNMLTALIVLEDGKGQGVNRLPDHVKNTIKYLDRHFKEEISLEGLAKNQHVSKYHLSREFKRCYGITIREYMINSRINYAKELLKYTDLTVNEIAYSCGIENVSHFINLFRDREEITPLAYRKKWK